MRTKIWLAGLLFTATLMINQGINRVSAAALNVAEIPANTTWVIYCNLDAATKYPAVVAHFLNRHPTAQKHIAKLEQELSIKFPQDFHDVVLVGRGVGPKHGVAIIHVTANQDRVDTLLRNDSAAIFRHVGSVTIREIHTHRHMIYETPAGKDVFVVARSEKLLLHEVHVIAGKAAAIKTNNPLLAGSQRGLIAYVAGDNFQQAVALDRHRKHHGPAQAWIRHVQSGWLACAIHKSQVVISGRLIADTAQAAAQMVQGVHGIQSMIELGGSGAKASPQQQFMGQMIGRMSVSATGNHIQIHWSMPLAKLLAESQRKPAASGQP